jgi:hypothetical protein
MERNKGNDVSVIFLMTCLLVAVLSFILRKAT